MGEYRCRENQVSSSSEEVRYLACYTTVPQTLAITLEITRPPRTTFRAGFLRNQGGRTQRRWPFSLGEYRCRENQVSSSSEEVRYLACCTTVPQTLAITLEITRPPGTTFRAGFVRNQAGRTQRRWRFPLGEYRCRENQVSSSSEEVRYLACYTTVPQTLASGAATAPQLRP